MIARMSRLEIAGPRELLLDVLEVIRDLGTFQPDENGAAAAIPEEDLTVAHDADQQTVAQHCFLENMRRLTAEIISLLPALETRESCLDPMLILDTIAVTATRHLASCHELADRRAALGREREELERHHLLLSAIERLIRDRDRNSGLEFIGITLRDASFVENLRALLDSLVAGECTLTTTMAGDGTLIGLIAVPASRVSAIRQALNDEQLPELPLPESMESLSMPQRIELLQERLEATTRAAAATEEQQTLFARRWLAFYRRVNQWLSERLALLSVTASVRRTGMCFIIRGWAMTDAAAALTELLNERFGRRLAVESRAILEQDLEKVPVALRNPPYFRPFELFTRLLPLPLYSSWDPTPFIGIFFPLFFGLMLGDAGHGLILLAAALLLLRLRPRGPVGDAARIILASAGCAVLFGLLFGEFFGEAGGHWLRLTPLLPERSRAVMPMLIFSLALGTVHVVIGLLLGLFTAVKRRKRSEAAVRIITITMIACLAASPLLPSGRILTRPVLVLTGVLLPLLVLSGGLLAPLEMLRTVGNIISYARIMAIGLSSALLANAANQLAGLSGDLILGTMAAIALHAVAIVLGLFAPAIHGLRLHFVEFFDKFVEPGGKRFEPLHK